MKPNYTLHIMSMKTTKMNIGKFSSKSKSQNYKKHEQEYNTCKIKIQQDFIAKMELE
jgi:hypothetical protein